MKAMWQERQRVRRYLPSLAEQGALAEMNYRRLQRLYAGQYVPVLQIEMQDSYGKRALMELQHQSSSRYTQTLSMILLLDGLPAPMNQVELWLRLYEDAGCAEVVKPVSGKQLQPYYCQPNEQMLAMDEKTQLNLFLADWLQYCLCHGIKRDYLGATG